MGTVRAMPCVGVPVTTARRAAALLSAKLAADKIAKIAPSTVTPKVRPPLLRPPALASFGPRRRPRTKPPLAGLRQSVGNRFERGTDLWRARRGGLAHPLGKEVSQPIENGGSIGTPGTADVWAPLKAAREHGELDLLGGELRSLDVLPHGIGALAWRGVGTKLQAPPQ